MTFTSSGPAEVEAPQVAEVLPRPIAVLPKPTKQPQLRKWARRRSPRLPRIPRAWYILGVCSAAIRPGSVDVDFLAPAELPPVADAHLLLLLTASERRFSTRTLVLPSDLQALCLDLPCAVPPAPEVVAHAGLLDVTILASHPADDGLIAHEHRARPCVASVLACSQQP